MDYSTDQIQTLADCDDLIQKATKEKEDLAYKYLTETRQHNAILEGSSTIEADLAAASAEIVALEAVVAGLPPGENLDEYTSKLKKAQHKRFLLEERRERYGVLGLLKQQFEVNSVEKQQQEIEAYIASLNQRREELG